MVARFGFFEAFEVLLELLLAGERGTVDAGQGIGIRVAVPVRRGQALHLERADPPGARDVRAPTQVDETVVAIHGHLVTGRDLPRFDGLDDLPLEPVIGEELGLVGVWFIIALYAVLFWRGVRIARTCQDPFGALLAIGITTAIGLQVSINLGVALGLLPTKGLTLPFLSYGGTSLLLNMASIGILMNIGAQYAKKA